MVSILDAFAKTHIRRGYTGGSDPLLTEICTVMNGYARRTPDPNLRHCHEPQSGLGPWLLRETTVTLSPSELCLSPLPALRTFLDLFDVGFRLFHLFVIFLFDVFVPRSSIEPVTQPLTLRLVDPHRMTLFLSCSLLFSLTCLAAFSHPFVPFVLRRSLIPLFHVCRHPFISLLFSSSERTRQ